MPLSTSLSLFFTNHRSRRDEGSHGESLLNPKGIARGIAIYEAFQPSRATV
ncbi:OLC1v1022164C1 [Oldenlandia corymbosa var. corymbosa]|uniref:OLC1v1022164C1 n=1 Tax=Oldenlandia corymbosa var. corymbosa TaxID=529605 RepID=A0AAV1BX87_OLDCO|nr:OLC1v1022164C1 [Oldenlandia corymbosa var. corymbosa]